MYKGQPPGRWPVFLLPTPLYGQPPDEGFTAVLAQTGFVAVSSPAWATLLDDVVPQALWVDWLLH